MSDDIGMKALGGPFAERARAVIAAGCDVALHCSGEFAEMVDTASAVPPLEGEALERFARAAVLPAAPEPFDEAEATGAGHRGCGDACRMMAEDETVAEEPCEPEAPAKADWDAPEDREAGRGRDASWSTSKASRDRSISAGAGAHAESRSRTNFRARTRRAISQFISEARRSGWRSPPTISSWRRGSLPEIEAATAVRDLRGGRADRRGTCGAARLQAAAARMPCATPRRS